MSETMSAVTQGLRELSLKNHTNIKNGVPYGDETFDMTEQLASDFGARNGSDGQFDVIQRKDYGTKGLAVDILTNHLVLSLDDDVLVGESESAKPAVDSWWKSASIYCYNIKFITPSKPHDRKPHDRKKGKEPPPIPLSKNKKYDLIGALFDSDETLLNHKAKIAFNGEDTLYSHVPLEEFTLFEGRWEISNSEKKNKSGQNINTNITDKAAELVGQILLKFTGKVGLKDIYTGNFSNDVKDEEYKMSAPDKSCLMALIGAGILESDDLVFQQKGNNFFLFNENSTAISFQIGGYLMHGFSVSLRNVRGAVTLNTINVPGTFIKHTKYLPGHPLFKDKSNDVYTLLDWIIECYQESKKHTKSKSLDPSVANVSSKDLNFFIEKNQTVQSLMKGLKVYRPYINYHVNPDGTPKEPKKIQSKSIVGLVRETANSLKFKVKPSELKKNGKTYTGEPTVTMSTTEYFKAKYDIKLTHPDVKLINLGGKNVVPAECLRIVPGQKLKGQIVDTITYINFSAIRPNEKFKIISELALPSIDNALSFNGEINTNKMPWKSFIKIPSRIIDAPIVQYASSSIKHEDKPFDDECGSTKGLWNLKGHKFCSVPEQRVNLRAILINDQPFNPTEKMKLELQEVLECFSKDAEELGVKFNANFPAISISSFKEPFSDTSSDTVRSQRGGRGGRGGHRSQRSKPPMLKISAGEANLTNLLSNVPPNVYILYVLKADCSQEIYNRLKYLTDLKFGVMNSCCQWENLRKKSSAYNSNFVMKMNLKLNGSNHSLSDLSKKLLIEQNSKLPALILGADVTHYPEKNQKSIASLVGSVDQRYSQFPGDYILQEEEGQEIIKSVGVLMAKRLELYQEQNNGQLPPKIIYFRDGISDPEMKEVVEVEVRALKEAIKKYCSMIPKSSKKNIPLTSVATVKRNQIRFMPLQKNAVNKNGKEVAVQSMENVMPGTVVDRAITSIAHFDFFIQSQVAIKGTGVSCHYWCIYDENNYSSDDLQEIAHNLCYIFGRSSTSIKVPAPIYYADLLCHRAASFFKANYNMNVEAASAGKHNRENVSISNNVLLPPVHDKIKNRMYYI